MIRLATFVVFVAAAFAGAKSYTVKLLDNATVGTMQLTPGEYKVEVNENTATIRNGKLHGECPVKVEAGDSKFDQTTVRLNTQDGKNRIQEIRLGGTKTKLVFPM